ncbi:Piso0_000786 [Millerozyma farinosa CBS 7064]|uniref:Piso0_000786 protein n=1 Tax=Pichia sorbitophila (strain ATCC MYA-4447 / BCRC 22081 / CBS 7064 / NBRC 10061 / NRRL Y-12695) TaxID=559304 RepID=G8YQ22_PICSO|nr:Piso0_000786 [Millerozyma farinosa CBS 7064]
MKIQHYACLFVCAKVKWSKLLQLLVKMHPTAYPLFSCGSRHNTVLRGATVKKSCSSPVNQVTSAADFSTGSPSSLLDSRLSSDRGVARAD